MGGGGKLVRPGDLPVGPPCDLRVPPDGGDRSSGCGRGEPYLSSSCCVVSYFVAAFNFEIVASLSLYKLSKCACVVDIR